MMRFVLGGDKVEFLLSVLFRYTFDGVDVLNKMGLVWEFDGDVSGGILDGLHGFNLCNDDELRLELFHGNFSLDQRSFILQHELPNRYFGRTDQINEMYDNVIDRYFDWKRTTLPLLLRCLKMFHETVFRSNAPSLYSGIEYKQEPNVMKMLLWCYMSRRRTRVIHTDNNTITKTEYPYKISSLVISLWSLMKSMKIHGIKLHANHNVLPKNRGSADTYHTVYMEFRCEHFDKLSRDTWVKIHEPLFFTFTELALQWWIPYKKFKLIKK
jgi:hypothetical protein